MVEVLPARDSEFESLPSAPHDGESERGTAEIAGDPDPEMWAADESLDQDEPAPVASQPAQKKTAGVWAAIIGVGASLAAAAVFILPKLAAVGTGYVVGSSIRTASAPAPTDADFARQLQSLEANPTFGEFYREFRTSFPVEYQQFQTDLIARVRGSTDPAGDSQYAFNWMKSFVAERTGAIATAADGPLAAMALQTATVGEILQRENVSSCAGFTITGNFGPPESLSKNAQAQMARLSVLTLRAIASGQSNTTRSAEPTEAQSEALWDAMLATQLEQRLIDAVFDGSIESLPAYDQCTAGVATNRAIAGLPTADSAYWTARGAAEVANDPLP